MGESFALLAITILELRFINRNPIPISISDIKVPNTDINSNKRRPIFSISAIGMNVAKKFTAKNLRLSIANLK